MEQYKQSLYAIGDKKTFYFKFNDKIVERMKILYSINYKDFVDIIWEEYNGDVHKSLDREKWYNNPETYYDRLKEWLRSFIIPNKILTKEQICKQSYKYASGKSKSSKPREMNKSTQRAAKPDVTPYRGDKGKQNRGHGHKGNQSGPKHEKRGRTKAKGGESPRFAKR